MFPGGMFQNTQYVDYIFSLLFISSSKNIYNPKERKEIYNMLFIED